MWSGRSRTGTCSRVFITDLRDSIALLGVFGHTKFFDALVRLLREWNFPSGPTRESQRVAAKVVHGGGIWQQGMAASCSADSNESVRVIHFAVIVLGTSIYAITTSSNSRQTVSMLDCGCTLLLLDEHLSELWDKGSLMSRANALFTISCAMLAAAFTGISQCARKRGWRCVAGTEGAASRELIGIVSARQRSLMVATTRGSEWAGARRGWRHTVRSCGCQRKAQPIPTGSTLGE